LPCDLRITISPCWINFVDAFDSKTVARSTDLSSKGFLFKMSTKLYDINEVELVDHPQRPEFVDISGKRFEKLLVIGFAGRDTRRVSRWWCACDCGNIIKAHGNNLLSDRCGSCGCNKKYAEITHGNSKQGAVTPTYRVWQAMRRRCNYLKNIQYNDYGGRGIKVCERWNKFENFLEDMGERPEGMSIDRIDVNGNYEPSNCRWATPIDQGNNKRNNVYITINNKTQTIPQWARDVAINVMVLWSRINLMKWEPERAITEPTRSYNKK